MFELKYFAKIDAFEKAEREATGSPQALPPFDVNVLGPDTFIRRATRRLTWWFFLFAFRVLRTFWPVARIGRLVVVSRYEDVCTVLKDREHFQVPFGPEMHTVTGGVIFALGLDGEAHDRQREIMMKVVQLGDKDLLLERTRFFTQALIDGSGGRIDALRDLCGRVFTETCSEYFALELDGPNGFLDRSMAISTMIFGDPFGTKEVRRQALNGAVRVRFLIDQAIAAARDRLRQNQPRQGAIIDRLVAYEHSNGKTLCPAEIRSIVIGIMTGMVPTSTLGAGKMLEELQRRGLMHNAVEAAKAAESMRLSTPNAHNQHRKKLHDMLFEALRLNPALSPGLFRYVPRATSIGGTPVAAGSVVLAGAMSALRDPRQFEKPGQFKVGRPWAPLPGVRPPDESASDGPMTLMFGGGSHGCLAAYFAMEQITEIFQILFSQDGICFSSRPAGRLAYLGLFPRRLDMEFQPKKSPSTQNMITIQAPIEPSQFAKVQGLIEKLGNPAKVEMGTALSDTCIVHFASMSAFDVAHPEVPEAKPDYRLVFELNVDGKADAALAKIAETGTAKTKLQEIFDCVQGSNGAPLLQLLRRHTIDLHFLPWGPIGLNFNGTPDCPVDDIDQQKKLAEFSRKAIDHYLRARDGVHKRALDALTFVRKLIQMDQKDAYDWAPLGNAEQAATEWELWQEGAALRRFLIRPSRRRLAISDWTGSGNTVGWPRLLRSHAALFVWLLIGTTAFLQAGAIHYSSHDGSWGALVLALLGFTGGAVLLAVATTGDGFATLIRWYAVAAEKLAFVATMVLAVMADILLIALLLVRWIGWPVAMIGIGVATYWGLELCLPQISLPYRLALAAVAAIVGRFVADVILSRVVPWLLRYWRTVVVALISAVAAACVLYEFEPKSHMTLRALAMLGAVTATIIVRVLWLRIRAQLRHFRRYLGLGSTALAVLTVIALIAINLKVVVAAIGQLGPLIMALGGGLVGTFVIWTIPILIFIAVLIWHESHDEIDERTASLRNIKKIAATENPKGYAHNHITAVTPLKLGAFRKVTLALALLGIDKLVKYWFRPGFVLNMGTIHYARWFRLPGSEVLVFFSNYDGSWQSYLEDFITKAHWGQSAAWSNGWGFPKTQLLVFGGAEDGDRFKRWVRRQQIVTQFWFSRFPELTTDQIRCNALIHHGLMHAQTDTSARAWLDCFGTIPRPIDAVETDEVQSLVFRGLPKHKYTICAPLTFSDDAVARKDWLAYVRDNVNFGELPDVDNKAATFVAFSARGIQKCLDIPLKETNAAMATFPAAFRLGMANRFRILGDDEEKIEKEWLWADIDRRDKRDQAVDAMLFIYGETEAACRETLKKHYELLRLTPDGKRDVLTQTVSVTTMGKAQFEHFGFRDGISQPIIRGSQKQDTAPDHPDVVEPGEMILGYKDSSEYTAPAITLPAELDVHDDLETDTPNFPSPFPRFGESHNADLRDFGRNGTFVVVRQLEQDVDGFNKFLSDRKNELSKYPGIADSVGGSVTEDWIAAKIMGRWKTGASIISWPHVVKGRSSPPAGQDNDFRFGRDDPQGLRCPLGAHIRRANPRGSLAPDDPQQLPIEKRHRLLRRGRPYEVDEKKGLMFVGLCADLERQFEFLQQTWIGSPNFHGLTNEPDPINAPKGCATHNFTIPTPSGPITMKGLPGFVTVKAGGYFFMPSRSALRFFARPKAIVAKADTTSV